MRGIRGAICADDNTHGSIYRATQALLTELKKRNELEPDPFGFGRRTTTEWSP